MGLRFLRRRAFRYDSDREVAEQSLEELVATWLGEDPGNWSVLRMTVIDPWKELAGV
jgi:hypothetical protein